MTVRGDDMLVEPTQPRYTKAGDGTHIAYSVMGDGPIDLVYAFGYQSNMDADGEVPFHAAFRRRLASFARLILFDRRGTGLSDRSGLEDAGALEAGMEEEIRRGSFQSKNGRVQGSLTAGPLQDPSFTCPSGQTRILAKVTYTNIVLTDTTNNVSISIADVCRSFSSLFPC